jgi:PAS domain S-box-containing protein
MTDDPILNSEPSYNFELFFELSADLFCIAGHDGYFKRINPAVSKLLEYTNEELFSKPINDFIYFEDVDTTSKARDGIIKSNPLLNFENRYVTKSGKIVWLSWTSMPFDSDKLVFAIAKNITHKKELEQQRNLNLANLTKHNKDLKQFTYTTAHDLRSPVNNLLSVFSLLDFSKINDQKTIEILEILKLAGEKLNHILNENVDVLIQKDTLNVEIEELNLNESLNEVLGSINALIQNSKVTITVNFSEVEKIKFNKTYLKSIFLNLITNAIKYAKPDVPAIISIYTTKFKGINQLILSDNGVGFDMDKVKDKIFGLHQKFHNHIDSKGVGLYLVYNHVTSLHGQIAIESKLNEGTKFIISFKD